MGQPDVRADVASDAVAKLASDPGTDVSHKAAYARPVDGALGHTVAIPVACPIENTNAWSVNDATVPALPCQVGCDECLPQAQRAAMRGICCCQSTPLQVHAGQMHCAKSIQN